MRIGIDLRVLTEGKTTGVEVYTLNLLKALFRIDKVNQYILFYNSFKRVASILPDFPQANVKLRLFRFPNRLLNSLFRFLSWPKIDKMLGGLDIFFSPRYLFGALSSQCKLVSTVHDLSFVLRPDLFSWKQRLWHRIVSDKKASMLASKIIAVSESTKKDLEYFFKIPESKITTIHPGLDHKIYNQSRSEAGERAIRRKYSLPQDFIMYLGTLEPRKNILGIVSAFEMYRKKSGKEISLVLAGRLGWLYKKALIKIKDSEFTNDIVLLSSFKEDEKPHLYRMANALIFPSFYEGFGFPPLEAAACGTPVVVSMNSSFAEVLGNACAYVNPYKIDRICKALQLIIEDTTFRKSLIDSGLERVKKYNWEKTARETLAVLESTN